MTTRRQWEKRREEIKRILAYYAVGQIPPPPGNVKGKEVKSETVLDGAVKYRLVHLTFGPAEKLGLDIGIFTPAGGGPFPAIILQSGTPPGGTVLPRLPQGPNQGRGEDVLLVVGPAAPAAAPDRGAGRPPTAQSIANQYANVFRRGYALVTFNPNDCAEDTTLRNLDGSWGFRNTRFYPAYPSHDWGILAGWAWGASHNGKSSMIAAAFDERLMGAPVVTGGGGVGAAARARAWDTLRSKLREEKYLNHSLAVEAIMHELAAAKADDTDEWGRELGFHEAVVHAVNAHDDRAGVARTSRLDHALYCADQVYWLVAATGLSLPSDKFDSAVLETIWEQVQAAPSKKSVLGKVAPECAAGLRVGRPEGESDAR